jgi:hypothetical protein
MTYESKSMDANVINIADCKTCKKRLLLAEWMILIRYCHQTAKTRAIYESTDGPAAQLPANPPNAYGLGDLN